MRLSIFWFEKEVSRAQKKYYKQGVKPNFFQSVCMKLMNKLHQLHFMLHQLLCGPSFSEHTTKTSINFRFGQFGQFGFDEGGKKKWCYNNNAAHCLLIIQCPNLFFDKIYIKHLGNSMVNGIEVNGGNRVILQHARTRTWYSTTGASLYIGRWAGWNEGPMACPPQGS